MLEYQKRPVVIVVLGYPALSGSALAMEGSEVWNDEVETGAGGAEALGLSPADEVGATGRTPLLVRAAIALMDGFNPCSPWVLTTLLGLVAYVRGRVKTVLVESTFLLVTGESRGYCGRSYVGTGATRHWSGSQPPPRPESPSWSFPARPGFRVSGTVSWPPATLPAERSSRLLCSTSSCIS